MRSPGTCLAAAAALAGTIACGGGAGTPLSASPPAAATRPRSSRATDANHVVSVPRAYDGRTAVPVVFTLASCRMTFGLSSEYVVSGDPSAVATATFAGVSGAPENVLLFSVVKGLAHQYPNGTNHPLNGARLHWQFLKAYRLPWPGAWSGCLI